MACPSNGEAYDAIIVKPMGTIVAGPLHREKGILYAEIDKQAAQHARRSLDVSGGYSRTDIFSFTVDRRSFNPVNFTD
jgi:nitrilase